MRFRTAFLFLLAGVLLAACGEGKNAPPNAAPQARQTASSQQVVAQFPNKLATYTLTNVVNSWIVQDTATGTVAGTYGKNTLLRFADVTVNLAMVEESKRIAPGTLQSLVELYIAYFNRVPDGEGLAYWIERSLAGDSLETIGSSFYVAGIAYPELTGYSSGMSDEQFVRLVYANVLGRPEPDAEGVAFWNMQLATGARTRGSLVGAMLSSAHSFKGDSTFGWVADLLDNKLAVGCRFAVEQGLSFATPEDSIAKGMQIARAVSSSSSAAATALLPAGNVFSIGGAGCPAPVTGSVYYYEAFNLTIRNDDGNDLYFLDDSGAQSKLVNGTGFASSTGLGWDLANCALYLNGDGTVATLSDNRPLASCLTPSQENKRRKFPINPATRTLMPEWMGEVPTGATLRDVSYGTFGDTPFASQGIGQKGMYVEVDTGTLLFFTNTDPRLRLTTDNVASSTVVNAGVHNLIARVTAKTPVGQRH